MKESIKRTAGPIIPARSHGIKVKIEKSAWKDMYGWCRAADTECSGLGLATLKDGEFHVSKVFFPEQYCSKGFTLLDKEAQSRLIGSLTQRHLAKFNGDLTAMVESGEPAPAEMLKFWWHTHYNFSTFWSGTDDDNAQSLADQMGDWSLSLVINQMGDWLCRADFVSPIKVMVDKLEVELIEDTIKHSKKNYKSDIRKWVKPMPEPKRIIIPKNPLKVVSKMGEYSWSKAQKKINHGGHILDQKDIEWLEKCQCSDNSCVDCRAILGGGLWVRE